MILSNSQNLAIKNIEAYVAANNYHSIETSDFVLYQSSIDPEIYTEFRNNLRKHSSIALHFHPDRLVDNGSTVVKKLKETGFYKNQFETKISAGSVTAFSGGFRDTWENEVFKGAYKNSTPAERPKYGSLNLSMTEDGPSPRFGSCYFLLKPEVKDRATFSYGDTHECPKALGTTNHFELLYVELFKELFTRGTALGVRDTDLLKFLKSSNDLLPFSHEFSKFRKASKNLDFYIEAQIHGDISLERDIEQLICDYSFYQTPIGDDLETLSKKYGIKINWNSGLELKAVDFPNNFRGPEVPEYAEKFSKNGILNAYLIGEASKEDDQDHNSLQMLKYLWHCLVRFGTEIKPKLKNSSNK